MRSRTGQTQLDKLPTPEERVKFFVVFNGTGTVVTHRSRGISSITDNGTGDYTLTFSVPFATASYALVGTSQYSLAPTVAGSVGVKKATTLSTGSVTITTGIGNTDNATDLALVMVAGWGV